MGVLVLCNNMVQARRIYQKLANAVYMSSIKSTNLGTLEIQIDQYNFLFITKDKLDICLRGRRDPKVIRAADLEALLDRSNKNEHDL